MKRTLVISEKDLTGEDLRRLHVRDLAEGFVAGRYRLTAEPGHDDVVRLLRGGMLDVAVRNTHATTVAGLTAEGGEVRCHVMTQADLGAWLGGTTARASVTSMGTL